MEELTRYPLSCILSYLSETEGTSLLITRKVFCRQILPIFRLNDTKNDELRIVGARPQRKRHRFRVIPVQDPSVLLARLNTRRLRSRQRQQQQAPYSLSIEKVDGNSDTLYSDKNSKLLSQSTTTTTTTTTALSSFEQGHTTTELARLECSLASSPHDHSSSSKHDDDDIDDDAKITVGNEMPVPTPTPCLLRFLNTPKERGVWFGNGSGNGAGTLGTILLVSYPRSGNTLVRTLLEKTTGLVTGSDTRPNRNLSRELAERHNLVGEGVCNPNGMPKMTPFVKTHWPERVGCQPFSAQRVILIVRNPYDAMDSYWNMNATCSHTQTVTDEVYERFHDYYQGLIQNEIHIWMKFHQYWLGQGNVDRRNNLPTLVVRFEDLIRQPAVELQKILQFTMTPSSLLTNTNSNVQLSQSWLDRIDQVVAGNQIDRLGSYQPRQDGGKNPSNNSSNEAARPHPITSKIGKSLAKGRFSNDLLAEIHASCADTNLYPTNYLQHFGYSVETQGFPDNFAKPTGHEQSCQSLYNSPPSESPSMRINEGNVIRSLDCPYGRKMTFWRHSVTDKDKNPLPTVSRSNN